MRIATVGQLCLLLACAGNWGCTEGSSQGPNVGTIMGAISYDGPAAGPGRPLSIAIHETYPPTGRPLRAQLIEDHSFPQQFVFEGLPPGTYYVGAALDIDRMDTEWAGMLNPDRDPHGYYADGAEVVLAPTGGAMNIDIELSGGAR